MFNVYLVSSIFNFFLKHHQNQSPRLERFGGHEHNFQSKLSPLHTTWNLSKIAMAALAHTHTHKKFSPFINFHKCTCIYILLSHSFLKKILNYIHTHKTR